MENDLFKTRQQIAAELGVSYRTLSRRMKAASLVFKGNLLCSDQANQIKSLFYVSKKDQLSEIEK